MKTELGYLTNNNHVQQYVQQQQILLINFQILFTLPSAVDSSHEVPFLSSLFHSSHEVPFLSLLHRE